MKLLAVAIVLVSAAAFADPGAMDRVITAPTAYLPSGIEASASVDHRGDSGFRAAIALGDLAAFEVGKDADLRSCADPCTTRPEVSENGHAQFTMATELYQHLQGAVGFQTTFDKQSLKAIDLHAVASFGMPHVRVHAGVNAVQARVGNATSDIAVRPLGGLEVSPPQYPKTSLLADFMYVPRLDPTPGTEWVLDWGVRYQAFSWGQVELAVRHREGEGLGDSTVMARFNLKVR